MDNQHYYQTSSASVQDIALLPSPVPYLVHTNDIPSKTEVGIIRSSVNHSSHDLTRVEKEISRLEAIMDNLRSKRDALIQFQRDHVPLLSCVRRLPPEILGEIFTWCLMLDDSFEFCICTRRYLSQVSQYWRQATFATPEIWALMHIYPSLRNQSNEAEMVHSWLSRSGQCPLSINIAVMDGEEPVGTYAHSIVETIMPYSKRWKSLNIRITPEMLEYLAVLQPSMPYLRFLDINSLSFSLPSMTITTFTNAPQLRNVTLGFSISPSIIHINWAQIMEYSSQNCTIDECLQVFDLARLLESCSLYVRESVASFPVTPVTLMHLKTLSIEWCNHLLDPLFDHLTLPALKRLEFNNIGGEDISFHLIVALLARSLSPLQVLDLSFIAIDESDTISMLELTPQLIELHLDRQGPSSVTAYVLSRLTPCILPESGQFNCLAPKLKHLNFNCYANLDEQAFTAMVCSRWKPNSWPSTVSRLERIEIWPWPDVIAEDETSSFSLPTLTKLRQCRDEGLDISLGYWMNKQMNTL